MKTTYFESCAKRLPTFLPSSSGRGDGGEGNSHGAPICIIQDDNNRHGCAFKHGAFVSNITWTEIEQRIQSGALGILPIGAAAKEHGSHLPMNTDLIQAEWLADQLIKKNNALVWPTINYGYYPAFINFPGSCSLLSDTFEQIVLQVLLDMIRHKVKKILILNTGISTIKPLEHCLLHTGLNPAVIKLANVYSGTHLLSTQKKIERQSCGGHADEIETSIMLAIAPKKVRLKQASRWEVPTLRGKFERYDSTSPSYAPDGIWGNPRLATAAKGKRLLKAMLLDLYQTINDALLHPSSQKQ